MGETPLANKKSNSSGSTAQRAAAKILLYPRMRCLVSTRKFIPENYDQATKTYFT